MSLVLVIVLINELAIELANSLCVYSRQKTEKKPIHPRLLRQNRLARVELSPTPQVEYARLTTDDEPQLPTYERLNNASTLYGHSDYVNVDDPTKLSDFDLAPPPPSVVGRPKKFQRMKSRDNREHWIPPGLASNRVTASPLLSPAVAEVAAAVAAKTTAPGTPLRRSFASDEEMGSRCSSSSTTSGVLYCRTPKDWKSMCPVAAHLNKDYYALVPPPPPPPPMYPRGSFERKREFSRSASIEMPHSYVCREREKLARTKSTESVRPVGTLPPPPPPPPLESGTDVRTSENYVQLCSSTTGYGYKPSTSVEAVVNGGGCGSAVSADVGIFINNNNNNNNNGGNNKRFAMALASDVCTLTRRPAPEYAVGCLSHRWVRLFGFAHLFLGVCLGEFKLHTVRRERLFL